MSKVMVSFGGGGGLVAFAIAAVVAIATTAGAVHDDGLMPSLDAGVAGDELGDAVALGNDTLLLGAPGASVDGADDRGAVHVYERQAVGWIYVTELTAPDGAEGDGFGTEVDLDEDTAIVGARGATVDGNASQGAAYVLEASEGNWTSVEVTKLVASDGDARHRFGTSVAVHEDTALVGATGVRGEGGLDQGAAYVYDASSGTWDDAAETKLVADDGDSFDRFGSAVALDEDRAVVGAPQANVDGNDDAGAAYVFHPDPSDWSEASQTKLTAEGGEDARFGSAVALDGENLIVGAQRTDVGENTNQGAAHLFTHDGSAWTKAATLHASLGQTDARFGAAVAIHGDAVAVGAPQADVGEQQNQGDIHLFVAEDDWANAETTRITGEDGDLFDRFGTAVALHGDTLLAGAPNADPGGEEAQGVAYTGPLHLDGAPPTITIDQVGQEGQPMVPGNPIEIQATAETGGSALASVEVAVDGEQIASEDVQDPGPAFPMAADWVPEQPGTYEVTATATDEAGASASASQTVEIGTGEQPELAVLDEVFPPVTISEPADGDTFAAGEEVAFTGTLRTGGYHGFVLVRLPGAEGLLATSPEPEPADVGGEAHPKPDNWDGVAFPGGTAGPFETVTIETDDGEVSIPENGDIFEEIQFPGDTWVEVEFPGDTSAEPMPGSDWEEIRFPGDTLNQVVISGGAFETITVESEDGDVSFPGDTLAVLSFPGDTLDEIQFPGDTLDEIQFPGDTLDEVAFPGGTAGPFETVTIETEQGDVSFPGDTLLELRFPGDTLGQVQFPGDTLDEVQFPGDTLSSATFAGSGFETVTIETEQGDVSFPGDTLLELRFPGDTLDQVQFPGDTLDEIRFPGDTLSSATFVGSGFETVTVEGSDGSVSFPGDTLASFSFVGDQVGQVQFPGDTLDEIQFPGDTLAEARFSENAYGRMTLSTTTGSSTFPGDTLHQVRFPGDTLGQVQFPGDTLGEIQFPGDTLQAGWSGTWTPDEPGTHEAEAFVFDAAGEPTSETVTFTVEEPEGSADAPAVGALVSILVIGGVSLVLRRR